MSMPIRIFFAHVHLSEKREADGVIVDGADGGYMNNDMSV